MEVEIFVLAWSLTLVKFVLDTAHPHSLVYKVLGSYTIYSSAGLLKMVVSMEIGVGRTLHLLGH